MGKPLQNNVQDPYKILPDHTLLQLSDRYSVQILEGRRKFMGLLPEIYRRRLYERRGCSSIFEFGAKLGALSEEQVRRALNLDERCERENLPLLRKAFGSGEVSINKLTRVLSIATPENEGELLEKAKILPNRTVEVMVKDFKIENESKSVHVHTTHGAKWSALSSYNLNLSPDILQKLLELQNKGIDLNPLLAQFLEERDRKIKEEKQAIVEEDKLRAKEAAAKAADGRASRYIRARTKNILKQEFGTKCATPHCSKASKPIHHTDRFSLSNQNNPYYLAPLCKDHHILAHSVDQKFQEKRQASLNTP